MTNDPLSIIDLSQKSGPAQLTPKKADHWRTLAR